MLRFGNITEVDPVKGYARVKFLDDEIVSDWLQIVVMGALSNKFSHSFDINEQVACLMDENSEEGVILGALYNDNTGTEGGTKDKSRVVFPDGSLVEYDRNSHQYVINIVGDVDISCTGQAKVTASFAILEASLLEINSDTINISGAIALNGSLTSSGPITAPAISAASISGPGVSMSGGNLTADGEINAASVKSGTIDLATHTHSGVTTGGGTSGPPTP